MRELLSPNREYFIRVPEEVKGLDYCESEILCLIESSEISKGFRSISLF